MQAHGSRLAVGYKRENDMDDSKVSNLVKGIIRYRRIGKRG